MTVASILFSPFHKARRFRLGEVREIVTLCGLPRAAAQELVMLLAGRHPPANGGTTASNSLHLLGVFLKDVQSRSIDIAITCQIGKAKISKIIYTTAAAAAATFLVAAGAAAAAAS